MFSDVFILFGFIGKVSPNNIHSEIKQCFSLKIVPYRVQMPIVNYFDSSHYFLCILIASIS